MQPLVLVVEDLHWCDVSTLELLGQLIAQSPTARVLLLATLFARGEPPAASYTFKHALIQETAYQSLLKRTRQQLHARVAEVLEERFAEQMAG